jgi:neutral trehalase
MTWVGLERYGYLEDAQRLAYRFLYMLVYATVDLLTDADMTVVGQDDDCVRRLQWRGT